MLSNGLAESLSKTYPGSVIHTIPGVPSANVDRLIKGEAEFVMTLNTNAYYAAEGHRHEASSGDKGGGGA
jgi:TRAP-type uncharacterized transport system substrate-binding protein